MNKCNYEKCKIEGCSQERLLGLNSCEKFLQVNKMNNREERMIEHVAGSLWLLGIVIVVSGIIYVTALLLGYV